jgi:hypothetical protein
MAASEPLRDADLMQVLTGYFPQRRQPNRGRNNGDGTAQEVSMRPKMSGKGFFAEERIAHPACRSGRRPIRSESHSIRIASESDGQRNPAVRGEAVLYDVRDCVAPLARIDVYHDAPRRSELEPVPQIQYPEYMLLCRTRIRPMREP